MSQVFTGAGIDAYRALAMRRAMMLWIVHGMKANRNYTPGNMARAAGSITGKKYTSSKKSLQKAVDDIAAMYPEACK